MKNCLADYKKSFNKLWQKQNEKGMKRHNLRHMTQRLWTFRKFQVKQQLRQWQKTKRNRDELVESSTSANEQHHKKRKVTKEVESSSSANKQHKIKLH